MALTDFLAKADQDRIVAAIEQAEQRTSGEVCVHVTPKCGRNVLKSAERAFNRLGLYKTLRRNAVLIYIAYKSHRFAIIGDSGINDRVPSGFWNEASGKLAAALAQGHATDGLCQAISSIGDSLAAFFPPDEDDNNELSNEITYEG